MKMLIVDDEVASRYGMKRALSAFELEIEEAGTLVEARRKLEANPTEILLLDVNLPDGTGIELLHEMRDRSNVPNAIIVITAHGSERMAADAIKAGAYDYLSKPFEIEELRLVVKNAVEAIDLRRENTRLKNRIESDSANAGPLIGHSEPIRRVRELIDKVADTDATVLIRGESGTGKELVARSLHDRSATRRNGSFVAVNCAALPTELIESELFGHEKGAFTGAATRRKGKFEMASGGTLFLDEIGDMSMNVQAKLLRALEERSIERLGGGALIPINVRFVSATHRPLEQEIVDGAFRADLFYRLRVVTIDVPALRERRDDIPLLADRFNRLASERYNIDFKPLAENTMRRLVEFDWPGNVRELRNAVERAAIISEGPEIRLKDLSDEFGGSAGTVQQVSRTTTDPELNSPFTLDFREDKREFERRYISRCLDENAGNVTRAAAQLGMHRQSLQHKLRELGLGRRYVSIDEAQEN